MEVNMADRSLIVSENVAGDYFVDENCTACGLCIDEAPLNFKMSNEEAHAYVAKQPENPKEEEQATTALENCPVDAIGKG
jgi:ferredoxin